jgi:hypothetical protein
MVLGFCLDSTFSQVSSARAAKVDTVELQKAQAALAKHEARLMNTSGVVGVGIGTTADGSYAAIHVYVNVEATGGAIPSALPKQLDGVPVRVIRTDEIKAQ